MRQTMPAPAKLFLAILFLTIGTLAMLAAGILARMCEGVGGKMDPWG